MRVRDSFYVPSHLLYSQSLEPDETTDYITHGPHSDVGTIRVTVVPIRAIKSIPILREGPLCSEAIFLLNPTMHHISWVALVTRLCVPG